MSLPPVQDIPQQLAIATIGWKKMRRLAAYAAFDGWSLTIFGALTLVCGGYGSIPGLLLSFALLAAGIFEINRVRQLRRLNPLAVSQLAYNQLALAGALILYALFGLYQSRHGTSGLPSEIEQALAQGGDTGSGINDQLTTATQMLYSGVIVFAVLVQGGTALFYLTRRVYFVRYLQETPDWIQQMQRERGEVSL